MKVCTKYGSNGRINTEMNCSTFLFVCLHLLSRFLSLEWNDLVVIVFGFHIFGIFYLFSVLWQYLYAIRCHF